MSSNDKAYKLSLDAFSKLRNDHELFLDAYEKPTQIYRFLKACHALKPLFLHRNLSYMKHRNSRRGKKRQRKFKIDDLINHTHNEKHDLASEIKSSNYLDITVMELRKGIDFKKMLDDPSTQCKNTEVSGSGQLMEVEVLLYHFTQPSTQGSPQSSCSYTTLGKCVVEYNSATNSINPEKPATSKEDTPSSFAIPESALTWKGRYGTQLVVFRVTPYNDKQKPEPKKVPSKKAPRKSLSKVSLSKLTMNSDAFACLQVSKQKELITQQVAADGCTRASQLHHEVVGERADRATGLVPNCKSRNVPGDALVSRACQRDACIMTDISYGTQVIAEQVGTPTSAPPLHPLPQPCCGLPLKKGYSEKCTSPIFKLAKNGLVKNGVSLAEGKIKLRRDLHSGAVPRDSNEHEANGDSVGSEPALRLLIKDGNGVKKKPLVIRVPLRYVEASASEDSQSEIDVENDNTDDGSVEWDEKRGRMPRRSEVQLLIDGDKPPDERVRASDIPVLLTEEARSRAMRRTFGTKASSSHPQGTGMQRASVDPSYTSTSPRKGSKRSLSSEIDVLTPPPAKHSRPDSEVRDDPPLPPPPPPPQLSSQLDTIDCISLEEDATDFPEEPVVEPPTTLPKSQSSQDLFVAELAIFDSRGFSLLEDGEYDLLMQRCPEGNEASPSRLLTFAPLSWDTVFGGGAKESTDEGSTTDTMLLKVTFHWRQGPPPHRLANDLNTALDFRKLREAYSFKQTGTADSPAEQLPMSNSKAVQDKTDLASCTPKPPPCIMFNFLYNNNTTQQTELKQELTCPWCCLPCRKIYSLLKHMSLCHPRFIFTYMPTSCGSSIDVHVNKLYDGTAAPEMPGECSKLTMMQKKKGPIKCSPFTAVLVEKGCIPEEEDITEFLNDGSWKRGINTNRQYYHTQSCTPLFPDELEFDSENDEIPEWQKICSQKMLDEFTDVNRGEKELMKLWNLFAMENRLIADKEISAACIKFATRMKEELIEKRIVYNFMAHLASLFDYGLVTATAVHQSLSIVFSTHSSS